MRLRERLGLALLGRAAATDAVNPALVVPSYQVGQPQWNVWDFNKAITEGFRAHAVVYACVRAIATNAASIPWRVMVGEKASETHRAAKLIRRPNPRFAWSDMIELLALDLNLAGNGYWYHIASGQTDELWRLRPDRMRVIPNSDGSIKAWEHKILDQTMLLPPEQVIHFLFHDPGNDWYGMSPLQAIARTVDTDNEAFNWNKASLQNRATPAGALISKPNLTKEQTKNLRELLAAQSEGPLNARKTMVLYGDLSWQQFGLSPQEMDFLASLNWSARMICSAFGVRPDSTGLVDATYENQRASDRALYEKTIIPFLSDQASALDLQLAPLLGGDAHFEFDISQTPAVTEARKERSEEAQRYFGMGISPRAINEHLGLGFDSEDCSETGFISAVLIPVDTPPMPAPAIPGAEPPRRRSINLKTEAQREHHWRRFDRQRQAFERAVAAHAATRFAAEGQRVEAAVSAGGRHLDHLVDLGRYDWGRMLETSWRAVIEHFGGEVADQLSGRARAVRATTWDPWKANVQAYVKQAVGDHVVGITDATKADLKSLIENAIANDLGTDEIAKGIRDLYEGYSTSRSYTIARTEVGGAANYGSQEAARQSGVVEGKEWITSRDDRVRDSHAAIDGEQRDLEELFSNGCMQPLDPSGDPAEICNCRCACGYTVRGEAEGELE